MSWLPKNCVVVPVDFSDVSARAISTALEMVDNPSAVHLLHVLFPLDNVSPGIVWSELDDQTREHAVREHFDKFLAKKNISGVTVNVQFGDPGTVIADYADELGADLIVIPSHGYHGVKRFVLGSVAERVIRHANCPVLVLRRDDAE
jgi:nucleotide-binding universal stress UspA family protein